MSYFTHYADMHRLIIYRPIILGIVSSFISLYAVANEVESPLPATADSIPTINLGDVKVVGVRHESGVNSIDHSFMVNHETKRVEEAIDLLPGITVRDAGARNEGTFYLRGFDQKRVPVFLDGIPIYLPYEGDMDIRRLQTASLAKVSVQRTMPSLLLGVIRWGCSQFGVNSSDPAFGNQS